METDFLQEKGEARYARVMEIAATRGRVLDRNGEALAVSTPVKSVWAIPADIDAGDNERRKLAALLAMPKVELDKRLRDGSRDFVYLKRQVAPETAAAVQALGLKGIHDHVEYRRYYPGGEVTAHVIGFTGVDDAGQEGIELAHQDTLGGKAGSRRVIRDRLGRIVEDVESIRGAQDGADLTLSIDSKIQSLAFGALKSAVERHRAKAGAVIVVDVRSGEVLALANLPSYNPNNRARLTGGQLRNRVITDLFEPGSTLKPFTVALALETGKIGAGTMVATAPGRLTLANYTIRDLHPAAAQSVGQVLARSSNVGAAKIALSLPRETMWDFFRRVGFGTAPGARLSGRRGGAPASLQDLAADRAGNHGLRARHFPEPGAARARVHRVRTRRGIGTADAGQNRHGGERGKSPVGRDRARGARDARAGGAARRYRPARPRHGMAGGRQDRHRAQAGERRLRSRQISLVLRRFRSGQRAAPGGGGDARRALGRAALRRRGRRARVLANHAGRAAACSTCRTTVRSSCRPTSRKRRRALKVKCAWTRSASLRPRAR